MAVRFTLNGAPQSVDAPTEMPLLWALRDHVGLTGTKFGCGIGQCWSCAVHVDGEAVASCLVTVGSVEGRAVTTIEGAEQAGFADLQDVWVATQVPQCGWCQPGQILKAAALLATDPDPDDAAIDAAMKPVLCRCGTYQRIRAAVKAAAEARR
jgi:isoquinoline 1-oxidoreductase alpha subunit